MKKGRIDFSDEDAADVLKASGQGVAAGRVAIAVLQGDEARQVVGHTDVVHLRKDDKVWLKSLVHTQLGKLI